MKTLTAKKVLMFLFFFSLSPWILAETKIFKGVKGTVSNVSGTPTPTKWVDVGDLNRDGVKLEVEPLPLNGAKKLFYLSHRPIHRLMDVKLNGTTLLSRNPNTTHPNYSYHVKNGWISLAQVFSSTNTLQVSYEWSDMVDVLGGNGVSGVAAPDKFNQPYRNLGNFSFQENTPIGTLSNAGDAAVADFNGDGYPDVVMGNISSVNPPIGLQILMNDGAGNFPTIGIVSPNPNINTNSLVAGDIDGDGQLDVAVSCAGGNPSFVFRNTGGGTFSQIWQGPVLAEMRNSQGIDLGDFDKDGDLDLLIANDGVGVSNGSRTKLWRVEQSTGVLFVGNLQPDGSFRIEKREASSMTLVNSISSYNGHVLKGVGQLAFDSDYLYFTNGGSVGGALANQIAVVKKSDLSFVAEAGTYGVSGSGPGLFEKPWGIAVDESYVYVTDASPSNPRIIRLDKNSLTPVNERGGATLFGTLPLSQPADIAVDSNYVYVSDRGNSRLVRLNKDLSFSSAQGGSGSSPTNYQNPEGISVKNGELFVSDLNNFRIKKMDTSFGNQQRIGSQGNGNDQFNLAHSIDASDPNFVYVADTENSRIHKRAKSNLAYSAMYNVTGKPSGIAFDDGGSGITQFVGPVWISPTDMHTADIQWADIDNDGDLDMVFANTSDTNNKAYMVYRNDGLDANGNPVFTPSWEDGDPASVRGVVVGDVDGDNYLDLVFVHRTGPAVVKLYLNNKDGSFTYKWGSDQETGNFNNFESQHVRLADFDKDGRLDVVATANISSTLNGEYTGIVVFKNQKAAKKVIKITSESRDGDRKTTVTTYFSVKEDGTLGKAIATEIK